MDSSLSAYLRWKSLLDRTAALLLMIPAIPLISFLAILIRLTSRGPGIYSQERVGKNGKVFTMYKLRSMRSDAEAKTGPVWSTLGSDCRVTRLGYWLRKLHFDELPQLFNVLCGEMSLIGPRPERPEFVKVLADSIPGYMDRLRVAPGITGLAQINLPPDTDLNSVRRKLVLDLEYLRTASFLLDLRMFICTLFRLIGIKGDTAMRVMWLSRIVHLQDVQEGKTQARASEVTPEVIATTITGEKAVERPILAQLQPAHRRTRDSEEFEFEFATRGK
jgi:lipopolysaccharide/colanic/teichoic acid biosynthesis glycosyltransferase